MKLFATPLSHFSRKVRLLLDHYEVPFELVDSGNVGDADPHQFHENPLMGVPVLRDEDAWIIESDHIAAYVSRRFDPADRYGVLSTELAVLNARAVLNGIMANEVKVILAQRAGLDTDQGRYFQKAGSAIAHGLEWLERRSEMFGGAAPTYLDFHFVSAWDHLEHYKLMDLPYPSLRAAAQKLNASKTVARSAPGSVARS